MKFVAFMLLLVQIAHAQVDIDDWVKVQRKKTTSSFKVYHWASRGGKDLGLIPNHHEAFSAKRPDSNGKLSEDTPLEMTPPEAIEYFKKMAEAGRKKTNPHTWVVGHGLYAGIDPIQSIMYAGKRWLLLEISVLKPVYYIDLSGPAYEEIVKKYGNKFFKALKENEISIIRYKWSESTLSLCERRFEAYNFIRPELIDEGIRINVFVEKIPAEKTALEEYKRLGSKFAFMFDELRRTPSYYIPETNSLYQWLKLIMPSRTANNYDLEKYQNENFECLNSDKLN